jgi:hypothetical protein
MASMRQLQTLVPFQERDVQTGAVTAIGDNQYRLSTRQKDTI